MKHLAWKGRSQWAQNLQVTLAWDSSWPLDVHRWQKKNIQQGNSRKNFGAVILLFNFKIFYLCTSLTKCSVLYSQHSRYLSTPSVKRKVPSSTIYKRCPTIIGNGNTQTRRSDFFLSRGEGAALWHRLAFSVSLFLKSTLVRRNTFETDKRSFARSLVGYFNNSF